MYVATLIGTVLAVVNIIIMIANYSVSDFYESFHLTSVLSFSCLHLGDFCLYCSRFNRFNLLGLYITCPTIFDFVQSLSMAIHSYGSEFCFHSTCIISSESLDFIHYLHSSDT